MFAPEESVSEFVCGKGDEGVKNGTNVNVVVKLRIPTAKAISYKHAECHKGVVKSFFVFEHRFHLDMHVFGHGVQELRNVGVKTERTRSVVTGWFRNIVEQLISKRRL